MTTTTIPMIMGLLLVTLTLLRGTLALFRMWRHKVLTYREYEISLSDFRSRMVDLGKSVYDHANGEVGGSLKLQVMRREYETPDKSVCSFYLESPSSERLPDFCPGQYLIAEIPSVESNGTIRRCYSLSESPYLSRSTYRITIKQNTGTKLSGPTNLNDSGSTYFHEKVRIGDCVSFSAPSGLFCLEQNSTRPVVLVAGGVGLTPILSMLNELIIQNSNREIWLFYGVRNRAEHLMFDHLCKIRNHQSNVQIRVFYSRPTSDCRPGLDYDYSGLVTVVAMTKMLKSDNYEFYICGPASMMTTVVDDLKFWGVQECDIFTESFGASSASVLRKPSTQKRKYFNISFKRSAMKVRWTKNNGSLLELAEACGIKARYGCRAGQCGSCYVGLEKGEVEYSMTPTLNCKDGAFLPCVAYPQSDLIIDM